MIFGKNLRKLINYCTSLNFQNKAGSTSINGCSKRVISSGVRHNKEEKFLDVFPEIVSSIVQRNDKFPNMPGIGSFIKELLEYNSAGGNKTRGLMTVYAYEMMEKAGNITEESIKRARILGWYVEMSILLFSMGQHMDYTSLRNYDLFTIDNYRAIASTKMAYYTFKLPTYCALLLANKPHEDAFRNMEDIVTDMGILIMMQNDYMDCFGHEDVAGKSGTDIQEGKCTWFAVTALQQCDAEQRAEFDDCYGSADEARVQRVKQLYERLQLPSLYRDAKHAAYDNIITRVQALPLDGGIPSAVMLKLLDMMYYMRSTPKRRHVFKNL